MTSADRCMFRPLALFSWFTAATSGSKPTTESRSHNCRPYAGEAAGLPSGTPTFLIPNRYALSFSSAWAGGATLIASTQPSTSDVSFTPRTIAGRRLGQRRTHAHRHVRQRQAPGVRQRRMGCQQLAYLIQRLGADLRRRGDAVAARRNQIDERLRRKVIRPLDLVPLYIGERLRQGHVVAHRVPGGADDAAWPPHPAESLVAGVPHQTESAAGSQHPGQLRNRPCRVEPVPRLRDKYGVNTVVRQRDLLRCAEQRGCFR